MTAKEMFEKEGLKKVRKGDYYIEYYDEDGLGGSHIEIKNDCSVNAYIDSIHEGGSPLELSGNVVKAIIKQLEELGWLDD